MRSLLPQALVYCYLLASELREFKEFFQYEANITSYTPSHPCVYYTHKYTLIQSVKRYAQTYNSFMSRTVSDSLTLGLTHSFTEPSLHCDAALRGQKH